jgi:hypothetical protein
MLLPGLSPAAVAAVLKPPWVVVVFPERDVGIERPGGSRATPVGVHLDDERAVGGADPAVRQSEKQRSPDARSHSHASPLSFPGRIAADMIVGSRDQAHLVARAPQRRDNNYNI